MPNRAAFLFASLAVCHLLAEYFSSSAAVYLTKPLLLLSLAYLFYNSVNRPFGKFENYLFAGLLLSCGGDILLLFSEGSSATLFFISGLSSFLLAHLCYIIAFYQLSPKGIRIHRPVALLFYGLAISLICYLWPALDMVMKIAISIYALTISTMGTFAYGMYQKRSYRAATLLLFGAIAFIFSDSMIAIDKFGTGISVWNPRITIMSSYILAQFWIVSGAILASKEESLLDSPGVPSSPDRQDQSEG